MFLCCPEKKNVLRDQEVLTHCNIFLWVYCQNVDKADDSQAGVFIRKRLYGNCNMHMF